MQGVPDEFRAKCVLCGHELDIREDGVYQWAEAWVPVRGQGGHPLPPQLYPRWAHPSCVEVEEKQ